MKKPNRLFHFIKEALSHSNHQDVLDASFRLKTLADQTAEYILIILPKKTHTFQLGTQEPYTQLHMQLHHLSIYEDYTAFSENNDYHYTARLVDKDTKVQYELHVYFDCQHKRLGLPSLKRINPETKAKETVNLSSEEANVFTDLAIGYAMPAIAPVRTRHQKASEDLTAHINTFVSSLANNVTDSISSIEPLLTQARLLLNSSLILSDTTFSKLLQQIQDNLEWMQLDLHQNTHAASPSELPAPQDHTEIAVATSAPKTSPTYKKIGQALTINSGNNRKAYFEAKYESLTAAATRYETAAHAGSNILSAVYNYSAIAKEAWALLSDVEDKAYVAQHTADILQHLTQSHSESIAQLESALKISELHIPEELLAAFAPHISDETLRHTIQHGTPDQVRLLLQFGKFPLDQIHILENERPMTLLEWAYANNRPQLFDILLSHAASPTCAVGHDLPLAYRITEANATDFVIALKRHYSKGSYTRLLEQLSNMLSNATDAGARAHAEAYAYASSIRRQVPDGYLDDPKDSALVEAAAAQSSHIDLIQQASPEVRLLEEQCIQACINYMQRLNPKERRRNTAEARRILLSELQERTTREDNQPTTEELVTFFKQALELYDKRQELLNLQESIQKQQGKSFTKGQARKHNKLVREHEALAKEIHALETRGVKTDALSEKLAKASEAMQTIAAFMEESVQSMSKLQEKRGSGEVLTEADLNKLMTHMSVFAALQEESQRIHPLADDSTATPSSSGSI